jgi:glutathione peroxidase
MFALFACINTGNSSSMNESLMDNVNVENADKSFYKLKIKALDEVSTISMSDFKGKKILLVNVASKCGYTYQYEGLQKLHESHGDKVQIIGFPCNQFLFQEPGNKDSIQNFCSVNYGVTFPLTEKISVKGRKQHDIYKWLTSKKFNGVDDYKVSWNFNKFLISESGELIGYYGSKVEPMSEEIVTRILAD